MGIAVLIICGILTLIYAYVMCCAARKGEEQAKMDNVAIGCQSAYEEYRRKFARDNKITIEQATEYKAVKNYKEYLETENNVVIEEMGWS